MGYLGGLILASSGKAGMCTLIGGGPGATLQGVLLRQVAYNYKRLANE